MLLGAHQTQNLCTTLYKCYTNVLCLLGVTNSESTAKKHWFNVKLNVGTDPNGSFGSAVARNLEVRVESGRVCHRSCAYTVPHNLFSENCVAVV